MDMKKLAAEKAVEAIRDGMIVGLGTGSTAYWAIQSIAERVKEGLRISAVATSLNTEKMARELGIPIVSFAAVSAIDISIDGADEVDKNKNLIKGGGGALLREKIIAYHSKTYLVIVDENKLVETLGKFLLPVEILPFAAELTLKKLQEFGDARVRQTEGRHFVTDNGNFIADLNIYPIYDPQKMDFQLHQIPGVLETGLFSPALVTHVLVGTKTGEVRTL
jgi:ribose 5-phosphate isomerase A